MNGMDVTQPSQALPARPGLVSEVRRLYTETFLDEWGARRAYRGRVVALVFLLFLISPVKFIVHQHLPPWPTALALAALATFGGCFVTVVWKNTPLLHSNKAPYATAIGIAVGSALIPVMGTRWLAGLSIYAVSMLIFNCDRRQWKYVLVGVPIVDIVVMYGIQRTSLGSALGTAGQTFLIGLIQAAFFGQIRAKVELRRARADLARLAVIEERLRISRDLHDILGQRLSAVSLKAEVASRLAHRNPDAASREMGEVADVARAALSDVRETVSGYRSVALASEIETARALLTAAKVQFTASIQPLPAAIDECAGWMVRETVTNVIRHARAANCVVRVISAPGSAMIEVSDDGGVELMHRTRDQDRLSEVIYGNGLTGLSERVNAKGGTLVTRRERGWFTVRATFELSSRS